MWPEREKITQATWSSPATNRMLLEAGFSSFSSKWGGYSPAGSLTGLVAITEQSTAAGVPFANPNFTYRGWASAPSNNQQHNIWRASMTYVTGAHTFKTGFQTEQLFTDQFTFANANMSYTFRAGVPISLTQRATPYSEQDGGHDRQQLPVWLQPQNRLPAGRRGLPGHLRGCCNEQGTLYELV